MIFYPEQNVRLYGILYSLANAVSYVCCSLHILCNRENQTPLHLACQGGHTVIVCKLLEKSQEDERKPLLKVHDNEGNTALHLAIESLRVSHLAQVHHKW